MSRTMKKDPRPESSISVVIYAEEFCKLIYQITNNEKQFPKAMRYTLSADLRNTATHMCKMVYRGCNKKPTSSKDIRKIRKAQEAAYDDIIDLKCLLVIATGVANPTNTMHIAECYDKLTESFNSWVKRTKRFERDILWKENATPEELRAVKMKYVERFSKQMPHDKDGFAMLVRKS